MIVLVLLFDQKNGILIGSRTEERSLGGFRGLRSFRWLEAPSTAERMYVEVMVVHTVWGLWATIATSSC